MSLELVEKRCSTCGETKPLSEFHRDKKSKDGHAWTCKPCTIARVKMNQAARRAEIGDEAYRAHCNAIVKRSRAKSRRVA